MGNCQTRDVVAAAVIQHPDGKVEKLYWPATAGEVMRNHPGHYVASVTFHISGDVRNTQGAVSGSRRLICMRLLKHKDLLLIGKVYRLVTSQEVAKALQNRKQERFLKVQAELMKQEQQGAGTDGCVQAEKNETERQRNSRHWRPSLQSISEAKALQ
ncbi:uncharacterized protein LOC110023472 [Phalaenopsis equestris]|uniref:uncharacterized protein LOC110023472 n=1 Tax=Phalaenopsis equestris TaxID=78828 RepID=UPI0009E46A96|nr:uncharacterized protein LOC110023472 [Phalaenopsis equestris]